MRLHIQNGLVWTGPKTPVVNRKWPWHLSILNWIPDHRLLSTHLCVPRVVLNICVSTNLSRRLCMKIKPASRKTILGVLGLVHTNPFSNENGAVLLRIRLSSTLQRRKRSLKTEPFENALQSGPIWKRCFLKTLFCSVDGENDAIWKRWRHQNHSTVSIQNGGQALPFSFNFAPISRADILKCACVEFIWPCALRV